jgi:hypothetical protein
MLPDAPKNTSEKLKLAGTEPTAAGFMARIGIL